MIFDFFKKKKVGLALSGGGARGLAHIGVLKVLHDHRVPIDYIAGTSSGALIGCLYASGMSIAAIIEIAVKIKLKHFFKFVLSKSGLVSSEEIERFVINLIGKKTFADLIIPFSALTVDLRSGEEYVLHKGYVHTAIRASCTFPWMYIPYKTKNHLFVDGVIKDNLPADVVRKMGADIIIGVDAIPRTDANARFNNAFEIFDRAIDVLILHQNTEKNKSCDVLITPIHEKITSLEFDKASQLINLGEEAAKKALPEIKRIIPIF